MDNESATATEGIPVEENVSPDWPYTSDDPTVPPDEATEPKWIGYASRLRKYSEEHLESLQRDDSLQGEDLWMDFTTMFSEVAFSHLPSPSCQDWRKLLTSRGVYVRKSRGLQISTALLACAKQAHFSPCQGKVTGRAVGEENTDGILTSSVGVVEGPLREPDMNNGVGQEKSRQICTVLQHSDENHSGSTSSYNSSLGLSGL
jgi:hypothetical protein